MSLVKQISADGLVVMNTLPDAEVHNGGDRRRDDDLQRDVRRGLTAVDAVKLRRSTLPSLL